MTVGLRMSVKLPKNLQSRLVSAVPQHPRDGATWPTSPLQEGLVTQLLGVLETGSLQWGPITACLSCRKLPCPISCPSRAAHIGPHVMMEVESLPVWVCIKIPVSSELPMGLRKSCQACITAQLCPPPLPAPLQSCPPGSILRAPQNKCPAHPTPCQRLPPEEPKP